jgi:Trp operon repressor
MVRISNYRLEKKSIDQTFKLLFEIVSKNKNRDEFIELLNEILSPTERIMIAKRVMIMYLLVKQVPQKTIADSLKVSVGTVSRYALLIGQNSKINDIVTELLTKEAVINLLSDFFHDLTTQPGLKIGHWQKYWDHEREKIKRETSGI